MTSVNDIQIGGDHYKSEFQHWDYVIEAQFHYLLGCATKYLTRWRKKNGIEDLEKARHYIQKYNETLVTFGWNKEQSFSFVDWSLRIRSTGNFITMNGLVGSKEEIILKALAESSTSNDFFHVEKMISKLIDEENEFVVIDKTGQEAPFGYDGEG